MHYVIEMRDTSMRAIGPFASQDAAAEWGANHNPEDDPRWQTIELDDAPTGSLKCEIFQPTSFSGSGAAQ